MPTLTRTIRQTATALTTAGLLSFSAAPAFAATPASEVIDAVFAEYDSTQVPGCTLGVYRNGEMHYARGYGMANLEYDLALTPDSVFRLASVSKQFVAAAIALLDEAGELDLDDDVREYFPELPDYGTTITLRHLVLHTSGIRDYLELAWLADWGEWYLTGEALRLIERQQALNFEPGSEYLYSNSGYLMLADVVHQVTGQTLREWSDEHLFTPLGMQDTHFHDDHTHLVPRRADGYSPLGSSFRIAMTQLDMVGDGGVYSTVRDLLHWHNNFADNQLGKGRQALIELMETPARLSNGESTGYGFGLAIDDFMGTREVSHGGSFVGFRTALQRYPEADLGVAVLCNRADASPTTLAREVAALFLAAPDAGGEGTSGDTDERQAGASTVDPNSDSSAGMSPDGEADSIIEVNAAQLQQHVGAYWNEEGLMRRFIVLEDGNLFYDRDGWSRSPLLPVGQDRFLMAEVPQRVQVRFTEAGMTVQVESNEGLNFQRYEPPAPTVEALLAFSGSYYSPELDHTQRLSVEGDALVLHRRSGPAPLDPMPGNRFSSDGTVLAFDQDEAGAVSGFRIHSGRVKDVVYRRRDPAAGSDPP